MQNQNLAYFCVLYQNSIPVGFIGRNGFIYSVADKGCIHHVENDHKIHLRYRLKPYARESVRIYHYPYNYLHNQLSLEYVEEKGERVKITFECQ